MAPQLHSFILSSTSRPQVNNEIHIATTSGPTASLTAWSIAPSTATSLDEAWHDRASDHADTGTTSDATSVLSSPSTTASSLFSRQSPITPRSTCSSATTQSSIPYLAGSFAYASSIYNRCTAIEESKTVESKPIPTLPVTPPRTPPRRPSLPIPISPSSVYGGHLKDAAVTLDRTHAQVRLRRGSALIEQLLLAVDDPLYASPVTTICVHLSALGHASIYIPVEATAVACPSSSDSPERHPRPTSVQLTLARASSNAIPISTSITTHDPHSPCLMYTESRIDNDAAASAPADLDSRLFTFHVTPGQSLWSVCATARRARGLRRGGDFVSWWDAEVDPDVEHDHHLLEQHQHQQDHHGTHRSDRDRGRGRCREWTAETLAVLLYGGVIARRSVAMVRTVGGFLGRGYGEGRGACC